VRVAGPGIRNGILQQYDGSFTVSTQGAGPGELTVKIRGPKGLSLPSIAAKFLLPRQYCFQLSCYLCEHDNS